MSKRNIRGKSGKQLYLNQLFLGGMKYTSSEMTEGVAKVISNFDISPTGDSAMPRTAFTSKKLSSEIGKYFYPVKFNQAINEQHYIEFVNTVSEDKYVNDEVDPMNVSSDPIKFYSRAIGNITNTSATIDGVIIAEEPTGKEEDLNKLFNTHKSSVLILENEDQLLDGYMPTIHGGYFYGHKNDFSFVEDYTDTKFVKHTLSLGDVFDSIMNETGHDTTGKKIWISVLVSDFNSSDWTIYSEGVCFAQITFVGGTKITTNIPIDKQGSFIELNTLSDKKISEVYLEIDAENFVGVPSLSFVYSGEISENYLFYDWDGTICRKTKTGKEVFTKINSNNILVYDGDTFDAFANLGRVRLLGINCPEIRPIENWGAAATQFLSYITDLYLINKDVYYVSYGKDKWNRELLDIFFFAHNQFYSLSETMIRCGLANAAYFYDSYPIQQTLYEAEAYAKDNNLCIHSDKTDPFLSVTKNKLLDNSEYPHSEYRYEFVRTTDSKNINSLLTNINDTVQFQYIDYLDSIAVLGRIINADSSVIYKGLMYIKPTTEAGSLNFVIELPPNNLDGETIDIITSQETGYNLMNKELINLEDSNDEHLVAGIKGLVVTDPTNKNIVMKATREQEVNLHAVMNYGYTNMVSSYSPTTFFRAEYQLVKTIITDKYTVTKNEQGNEVNRNPVLETKVSTHSIDLIPGNSYNIIAASSAEKIQSVKFRFTKLELVVVSLDGESKYDVSSQIHDLWKKGTAWDGWDLENKFGTQNKAILNLATNNLGVFDIQFDKESFLSTTYKPDWNTSEITKEYKPILYLDIKIGDLIPEDYLGNHQDTHKVKVINKIFGKWEKAKYGTDLETDEGWTIISDEERYIVEDGILKPIKNNPEDIMWVVDELTNISLKYIIYTKFFVFIEGISNHAQIVINSPESLYLAMPLFQISHTAEFLDQKDILNNINIKDATRIGIFNRQLYLYGPKTKSNFLQFSMFEEQWYLPFPYYNIEIPEPIVYVYPYLDSLVVFGKYNIYMLTGGVGVLDLKLHKIYENLSITAADVNLVNTVGTYLMFFNNNIGYLMVPNTYSDDPTNIKVYKLTDNISNALLNPEPLIKAITNKIDLDNFATTIFANYTTFVDSNVLYIAANYTWTKENTEYKSCIIYRYNQTYKYWNLYYSPTFTELNNPYISEPQLGVQYITTNENVKRLTFLNSVHTDPVDKVYDGNTVTDTDIETYLDTGYLSVDTMNDKRFKDIIIEFDNIKRYFDNTPGVEEFKSDMDIKCNFFIDGTPMFISEQNNIQIENQYGESLGEIEPHIPLKDEYFNTALHHISDPNRDSNNPFVIDSTYGIAFKLGDSMYTNVGRTHVRIPVFGKGRLPSFTLRIVTKNNYEFINYSLIYKEKNINRRR